MTKTIRRFFPQAEILAFGSRVEGTARQYSDLDLALRSDNEFSSRDWLQLEEALENSELPFKVDLLDFSKVSEDFKKIISKTSVKWG